MKFFNFFTLFAASGLFDNAAAHFASNGSDMQYQDRQPQRPSRYITKPQKPQKPQQPNYGDSPYNPQPTQTSSTPSSEQTYGSDPSSPSTPSADTSNLPFDAQQMLKIVNQIRAQNGASPLTIDPLLTKAAQDHSVDQAKTRNMSHSGSDGSSPSQRVARAGYKGRTVAENVAWNQKTVDVVMNTWKNSPGHFQNIVGKSYTKCGFGMQDLYWTQVFAA